MLRNTLQFLFVTTFAFLTVNGSTNENLEVNNQVTTDKLPLTSNDPDLSRYIEENNIKGGAHAEIDKVDNPRDKTKFDAKQRKNTGNDDEKSNESHGTIQKIKQKPLWKFKDKPGKRQEPGIDLTPEQIKKFKIWKGGVIPYYIDVVSFSDKVLRDSIQNYLQMVNSATGINFIELPKPPPDDNERWVFFMNRQGLLGCADHTVMNFTNQGVQKVVLGYDCMATRGELGEAVMSIVGVPAQHNAPDRDKYIQVNMENIMPDKKYLFQKLPDSEWLFQDLKYDFNSITHYDLFKYSANGRPTIQLKNVSTDLGLAKELSPNDLRKIKMLYNYITRNVKLQATECEKLFKPRKRSTLERFAPPKLAIGATKNPTQLKAVMKLSYKYRDEDFYLQRLLGSGSEERKRIERKKLMQAKKEQIIKLKKQRELEKQKREEKKVDLLAVLSDYQTDY